MSTKDDMPDGCVTAKSAPESQDVDEWNIDEDEIRATTRIVMNSYSYWVYMTTDLAALSGLITKTIIAARNLNPFAFPAVRDWVYDEMNKEVKS